MIGNIRSDINEYLDSFLKSSKSSKYVILSLSNCDGSQNVDIREAVCDQVNDILCNVMVSTSMLETVFAIWSPIDWFP